MPLLVVGELVAELFGVHLFGLDNVVVAQGRLQQGEVAAEDVLGTTDELAQVALFAAQRETDAVVVVGVDAIASQVEFVCSILDLVHHVAVAEELVTDLGIDVSEEFKRVHVGVPFQKRGH